MGTRRSLQRRDTGGHTVVNRNSLLVSFPLWGSKRPVKKKKKKGGLSYLKTRKRPEILRYKQLKYNSKKRKGTFATCLCVHRTYPSIPKCLTFNNSRQLAKLKCTRPFVRVMSVEINGFCLVCLEAFSPEIIPRYLYSGNRTSKMSNGMW